MKLKVVFTVVLLQMCVGFAAQAQTITLSVAASMTDAFKEMIVDFSAGHADVKFLPNFASSGSLAKQIEQGAPADVYVSANPKWMKYLLEKELIAPGTDRIFAFNQLVFVGMKKTGVLSLAGLSGLERIALGTPQSVPAGQYAKQAMEHAGVYASLEEARKLVMAKDVRQALIYADRGEVDGSFVYKTDALLAKNAEILFVVPEDHYDRVSYPVALTPQGTGNDLAQAFYEYLKSPKATEILARYGFQPAP
ncbi:MAG: molybdate ABC transporter substrate-binding protein [Desulfopila sp.]|jgi:molybdate transport system substrate-binding protein|nr:molybdate ABC transporter substrate-binding protein [Desulfopila sp.]